MNKRHSEIQMNGMQRLARVGLIVMLGVAMLSSPACKSKKKLLQEQQAVEAAMEADRIAKAKAILLTLLDDNSGLTLEEKERQLALVKNQNINDPEIKELIRQVEAKLVQERAELERARKAREREEALAKAQAEAEARKPRIANYFNQIANASSITTANSHIEECMKLFASKDIPVLIIINENRNATDYDRPTTIGRYLEYLKDQKKNINRIKSLAVNIDGKITEMILTKE